MENTDKTITDNIISTLEQNTRGVQEKMEFVGLMPPVFTPFKDDYSINLSVIPKYVNYLQEQNIKGILVNGTSGEGMSMSVKERKLVAETWIKEAHRCKMHVMIQVGGAPLPDVISLAKHAEEIKADSILTLPDLFNKPTYVEELITYLGLISNAAPNTPLLYYHNPGFTNVDLNMPLLVSEAKKSIKTFKGLKFTSTDLKVGDEVLEKCGSDCTVFLGADQVLVAAFTLGFDSSIGTTFNMMSNISFEILKIFESAFNTDLTKARFLQRQLNDAINIITSFGKWVPTMKAAMEILTGIQVGPTRAPTAYLTENQRHEMKQKLQKLFISK